MTRYSIRIGGLESRRSVLLAWLVGASVAFSALASAQEEGAPPVTTAEPEAAAVAEGAPEVSESGEVASGEVAATAEGAPAAETKEGPKRPKYRPLRQDEDWTEWSTPAEGADFFDPIKNILFVDDPVVALSLGGQVRVRHETWRDFAFGAPADPDDSFLLARTLLHADLHVTDMFRAFVQGKSSLSTDRDLPGGKRTLDVDEIDLQQAFGDFRLPVGETGGMTFRAGRQELLLGKQRLVSPLDWSNTRRAWDGFTGILEGKVGRVTGFYTHFVPVQKYDFNTADAQTEFFGLYGTLAAVEATEIDLYFLGLLRDAAAVGAGFNGTAGAEDRLTLGGRVGGGLLETGLEYDLEGAYQFGEVGRGDVDAFMVTGELAFPFAIDTWKIRPRVGAGYASGDERAGGDVETFNQLFPLGHAYLGYMDLIGRQNVIDGVLGVRVQPSPKLWVQLDGHHFSRAEKTDAVYNAGGGVLRAPGGDGSHEVGWEIDLTASYQFDLHAALLVGYGHFFAGDFIKATGPNSDPDFIYIQFQYTF